MNILLLLPTVLVAGSLLLVEESTSRPILPSAQTHFKLINQLQNHFLSFGKKHKQHALPPRLDLVFLVDSSSKFGRSNRYYSIRLIWKALDFFSISPGTTRVALLTYNNTVNVVIPLGVDVNRECVIKTTLKEAKQKFYGGGHNLGAGLEEALEQFRLRGREEAKRMLVYLGSGFAGNKNDTEKMKQTIDIMKKIKVTRIVVGTGSHLHRTNLHLIASPWKSAPGRRLYFFVKNFRLMHVILMFLGRSTYASCPRYRKARVWYDECMRRCTCYRGNVIKCQRVRYEFTSMTNRDRRMFVEAYLRLTRDEPYRSSYISFIRIHSGAFLDGIHEREQFLPWHRWFLTEMENFVKRVDCRVTYPYWDWSLRSHDAWGTSHVWRDNITGLGSISAPDRFSDCVQTGPFREGAWINAEGDCMRRWMLETPPDAVQVATVKTVDDFIDFELMLRVNLHDTVHCFIGGLMCTFDSATVPEFFMHHGFVDKIWHEYQQQGGRKYRGIFGKQPLSEIPYTAEQWLNITASPGCVSIVYDEPNFNQSRAVKRYLNSLSQKQLLQIPRRLFRTLDYQSMALFRVNPAEQDRAIQLKEWTMRHVMMHTGNATRLDGVEKTLGFKIPAT